MDRWKSPIDLQMFEESFATKILEDQTGCVIETCVKMGVNVDKDELIKALSYDRGQYEKGYSDGRMARDDEIVRCKDCMIHDICRYRLGLGENGFCSQGRRNETVDG